MCYDTLSLTQNPADYARRLSAAPASSSSELEQQFAQLQQDRGPLYQVSGFSHPWLPLLREWEAPQVELFQWGLIPFWTRDSASAQSLARKTLNARLESIYQKPSFRAAAPSKRCLVITDGFYEHHHRSRGTQPYLIRHKWGEPLLMGGLYEEWHDPQRDQLHPTFTIVTTQGNELMARIHNNPKLSGPRMPVIIAPGEEHKWLSGGTSSEAWNPDPFPSRELEAYPVAPIRGKKALGNVPEAMQRVAPEGEA